MKKKDIKILVLIILLKLMQAVIYMLAKISPFIPTILGSSLDDKIPFISQFIFFYYSWYIIIIILPFLYYKKDELRFKKYLIAYQLAIVLTFIIYFLFPTMINRPSITINNISDQLTMWLYQMDNPALNCFPSMHCLLCFLHVFNITKCKNTSTILKINISVWALLIVLSTLFVKQHVIMDVVFALVFAVLINLLVENVKITRVEKKKKQG